MTSAGGQAKCNQSYIVGVRYEEYSSSKFSGWAAYERINICSKKRLGKEKSRNWKIIYLLNIRRKKADTQTTPNGKKAQWGWLGISALDPQQGFPYTCKTKTLKILQSRKILGSKQSSIIVAIFKIVVSKYSRWLFCWFYFVCCLLFSFSSS